MAHQDIQSTYSKYNILENRKEKQGQEEKKNQERSLGGVVSHIWLLAFESRLFVLDSGAHRTRKHAGCPDETVTVL